MRLHLEPPRLPTNAPDHLTESLNSLRDVPYLLKVADDGTPTFATENEELTLTKRIARIDVERGGLLSVRHDALAEEHMQDVQTTPSDRPTSEELLKIKEEMYWRLERNRQSLLSGWSLLHQILPHQAAAGQEAAPTQFPPDAFGTTLLDLPLISKTAEERLFDASMTLARRQNDLKGAAERLQGASTALQRSVERSSQNWSTWLGWAGRGRVQAVSIEPHANFRDAQGVSRAAKNLLAYFGFEEAAERFRGSSYAGLDDDGKIALHPRRKGRRRLTLRIRLKKDGEETTFAPAHPGEGDILEAARLEVFDEELFARLSDEPNDPKTSKVEDSLAVALPDGGSLNLSMVSIDQLPEGGVKSPLSSLIVSFLRLRMIALYRYRRIIEHPALAPLPRTVRPPAPLVLAPTISLLALHLRAARLLALMRSIAALLPKGDAAVNLATSDIDLDDTTNGAIVSLRLPGSVIHARISADATAVFLDLTDGRMISPANEAILRPALDFEVRRAYAIELGSRLQGSWRVEKERGRCTDGKRILQLSFDSESGLSCTLEEKRYPRDAEAKSLYDWVAEASKT